MYLTAGDCLELLPTLAASSVDAIICDPPYGIGFMGRGWDHEVPGTDYWRAALRVAKPGAYLLAFAGTRKHHRLACAIEDAGWELRDTIMWVYGSGFPKSRDVGREVNRAGSHGADWEGWGTALKPAWEPIILARKPFKGSVGANVAMHGTGALNIAGCRVALEGEVNRSIARRQGATNHLSDRPAAETEAAGRFKSRQSVEAYSRPRADDSKGRWPANLVHDGSPDVLAQFPEASGQKADLSTDPLRRKTQSTFNPMAAGFSGAGIVTPRGDAGSAARFFYCAKASAEDRGAGNHHPTVKPFELMRWLCRLVTPPGGIVLDMFCGSGSTGKAAKAEGLAFIGFDLDPANIATARRRIDAQQGGLAL